MNSAYNPGDRVDIHFGSYTHLHKCSAIILESIGNGYLAQTDKGYCALQYDLKGDLHANKIFKDKNEARAIAVFMQDAMS